MSTTRKISGLIGLAIAASCGGGGDGPTTPGTGGTGGTGGTTQPVQTTAVSVTDNVFSPNSIRVAPGATVTWTWATGATLHNVTFASGASSQNIASGATFQRAFPAAGTFSYQCTLHPGMTGTVTVQ